PNMNMSQLGSRMTMRVRDANNGLIASTTAENIDGINMQIDFDWSGVGATLYTVQLFNNGMMVAQFSGLPRARLTQAAGDVEECN
ncbi:MAG: hypothetical protein KDC98_04270, partial [Planctomycetes bacterium]|nr:hypothetical protein [Planctomycetota bacterium]